MKLDKSGANMGICWIKRDVIILKSNNVYIRHLKIPKNPRKLPLYRVYDGNLFTILLIMTISLEQVKLLTICTIPATNVSGVPLVTISSPDPGEFTLNSLPSATVASSSNSSFQITFIPIASGLKTAIVTINSNDDDEASYSFSIQCTGLEPEMLVKGIIRRSIYNKICISENSQNLAMG
ncbi:MAG: hypothetical protein KTR26_18940 [Flammeovirgaceae bacterium]|nr:hypothetical protein [Flammeovirgaceae bacterium]